MAGLLGLDDDAKLGLLTAALAAMSARGVRPGTALAQGGLLGLGAMQNARAGRADERRQQMQEQLWQSQMAENLAAAEERRAKLAREEAAARGDQEWGNRIPSYLRDPSPVEAIGSGSPTVANAALLQQQPAVDQYAKYSRLAEAAVAARRPKAEVEMYLNAAEKYRTKYSPEPRIVMKDGKPVYVQTSETAEPREMGGGYTPPPKLREVDRGGQVDLMDDYSLTTLQTLPKTMTLEGKDASARGWAEINDRRKREAAEGGAGKPPGTKFDASSGMIIEDPSPKYPQGRAFKPEGYPEKQGKNADLTRQIPGIIAEAKTILDSGRPSSGAGDWAGSAIAGAFGKATEGAKATAELDVLGAKLMFAQPRFEGPQGVLDVKLYERAAADLANPLKPIGVRRAALSIIEKMHQKYGPPTAITGGGLAPAPAGSGVDFVYTPGAK